MANVYVLNYSENSYQKERVRKAVKDLGATILNCFAKRPTYKNSWNIQRESSKLLLEEEDFSLMKSAQEIWIVSSKAWFNFLRKGEKIAKRCKTPIRYFSICHQGPYAGNMKEVERNYLEDKN